MSGSAWTGPHRHASGAQSWRCAGSDWLVVQHKATGIALYTSPADGVARLVSVGFASVAAAQDYAARWDRDQAGVQR